MAKARKKTRKAVAKRPAKKATRTAKLKGRKVAGKPKARRAKKKQGLVASAVEAIGEAVRLRTRLGGHNNFED
jgi:hypothetical protein